MGTFQTQHQGGKERPRLRTILRITRMKARAQIRVTQVLKQMGVERWSTSVNIAHSRSEGSIIKKGMLIISIDMYVHPTLTLLAPE